MFASAIAPTEVYSEQRVTHMLSMLGQDDPDDVRCVYCDQPAETWDHLQALVHKGRFSGHGHQLGNLVPSCKSCNSKKGNRPFEEFLRSSRVASDAERRIPLIARCSAHFLPQPMAQGEYERRWPEEMATLERLRDQVLDLMAQADVVATGLREAARVASSHTP